MTPQPEPCRSCGAPVTIDASEQPRKMGQKSGQAAEARVCTDPNCSTHDPQRRKLGERA